MNRFVMLLAMVLSMVSLSQTEIRFLKCPAGDALAKAKAEKKHVLVDFYTDWCRWCDTLDNRTYSDARVEKLVSGSAIPLKVDAEKGEGVELARKYSVRGFPTVVLIDTAGTEIDRIVGYVPPDAFLNSLSGFLKNENTIGSLKAAFSRNSKDPGAAYALAHRYSDRFDAAEAADSYVSYLALDPANSLNHHQEALFAIATSSLRTKNDASGMERFVGKYPSAEESKQALAMLMNFYLTHKQGDEARKAFDRYDAAWPGDAQMMNNYAWTCATQKTNLAHAAEVSARSVARAATGPEKAMYMDTQAAVAFARGDVASAVSIQESAIALLANVPAKEKKPYEESLAKYRAVAGTNTK